MKISKKVAIIMIAIVCIITAIYLFPILYPYLERPEDPLVETDIITVYGRVTDEAGNPVVGASVEIWVWLWAHTKLHITTTNDDGEFIFANIQTDLPYSIDHMCVIPPEGFALAPYIDDNGVDNIVFIDKVARVDIILKEGGFISGRVVDGAGNPVASARIYDGYGYEVKSDNYGNFTTRGLAPGTYALRIITPENRRSDIPPVIYIPEEVIVVAGKTTNIGNISLAGGVVSGRVTDNAGNPVAGAEVWTLHPASGFGEVAVTDDDGNFMIKGLHQGNHLMKVFSKRIDLAESQVYEIMITPGETVIVTVTLDSVGLSEMISRALDMPCPFEDVW